jgi:multimeric flavodoxin WrbA
MKVVIIHGQNHKGSSYHIGRMIIDKLDQSKEIKEFFLPKDLNHFCLGCYKCIEDDTACPFYNDKRVIMESIEKADVLIFTTPTYCLRASAPMRTFIDLTFTYWMSHRPRAYMFNKKAVVISTAAGSGTKQAIKDISNTLFFWGVPWIKKYGINVQAMNWESIANKKKEKIEKQTSKIAKNLVSSGTPKVGIKTKFMFNIMRKMQMAGWGSSPVEKQYWSEKGWLDKKRPW